MKLRRLLRLAALVFLPLIAPGIHGVPMRDFVASATAPTIALPAQIASLSASRVKART